MFLMCMFSKMWELEVEFFNDCMWSWELWNEKFCHCLKTSHLCGCKDYENLIDDSQMWHVISKAACFFFTCWKRIVLLMIRICCIWGFFVVYEQQKIHFWVLEYLIFLHPRLYFYSVRGWNYIKIQYQKPPADSHLHGLLWELVQVF